MEELPTLMPKPLAVCATPAIKLASTQMIQMREVRIRLKRLPPISFLPDCPVLLVGASEHGVVSTRCYQGRVSINLRPLRCISSCSSIMNWLRIR